MISKEWWQERSRREHLVLTGGFTILIIIIAYLLLEPVLQEREGLAEAIPGLRADLAWMQAHSGEMRELLDNNRLGGDTNRPLLSLSLVQTTLRETGLLDFVVDLSGTTQNGISLNVSDVAFSDLVQFLYLIRSRTRGAVKSAEITRSDEDQGIVTANIVLSAAGM